MGKTIFALGIVFSSAQETPKPAQSTHPPGLSGTVKLEAKPRAKRRFRGARYRQRGSGKKKEVASGSAGTEYENTIISATPLSYPFKVIPLKVNPEIAQKGAAFIPHVTPVTVGSRVNFVNNDPFYHNVFSLTPGSKFNIGRRPTGEVIEKKIKKISQKISTVGEIKIFCDIHTSMKGIILSLETPFFTRVQKNGKFELPSLKKGTYAIKVYHPNFPGVLDTVELAGKTGVVKHYRLGD